MFNTPFQCQVCGNETWKLVTSPECPTICCPLCSAELSYKARFGDAPAFSLGAHPSERCVVLEHPKTGEIRYIPRNDIPTPARYAAQGFQRRELPTLRDIEKFEKAHNVQNEAAWFDRGSGREF